VAGGRVTTIDEAALGAEGAERAGALMRRAGLSAEGRRLTTTTYE
jgi:hypothetical protein